MPVFYFLVLIGAVGFWFMASSLYKPIGSFFRRIFRDARDCMTEKDEGE